MPSIEALGFPLLSPKRYKKCSIKFSLLKKAILGLGVWEPQKYFHIKLVHCLLNIGPQLFFEHSKVLKLYACYGAQRTIGERKWTDLIWKYFWGSQTPSPNIAFFNKLNLSEHFFVQITTNLTETLSLHNHHNG